MKSPMFSRSLPRLILFGLTALAFCLSSATAFAGEEEAKEFYSQAKDAYQAGEFSRAADLLERAYAEDPNLIYQYNRILALQGMEEYAEALRVLDIYENPMREDGRFDDITEIRNQLEASLAEKKAGQGEGNETEPDDTVDSDQADSDQKSLEAPGKTTTVDSTVKRDRIVGWSLVGAGVAAAVAGSPFYTKNPDTLTQDQVKSYRTISVITLSSAVVLGGVGGYFLYRGYSDEPADGTSASRAGRLHLAPYVATDGAGGTFILTF